MLSPINASRKFCIKPRVGSYWNGGDEESKDVSIAGCCCSPLLRVLIQNPCIPVDVEYLFSGLKQRMDVRVLRIVSDKMI